MTSVALEQLFEREMVDGIRLGHRLRVRTLDANGENAFREGDYETQVDFIPLSENRLGRRMVVPMPVGAQLAIGDYTFEMYLDGQHLGSLDFPVLARR